MKFKNVFISIVIMVLLSNFIFTPFSSSRISVFNDRTTLQNTLVTDTDNTTEYWGVIIEIIDTVYNIPSLYTSITSSKNWNSSHVIHIIGANASKKAILESIDWMGNHSDSNDIVFFAVSSHGFSFRDSRGIVSWYNELISIEKLNEKFNRIEAQGTCLLFDCCHSGEFVKKHPLKTHTLEAENRVVLMSTWRSGLGTAGWIEENNGTLTSVSLRNTVGEAFDKHIDYNNDSICSVEEAFQYAQQVIFPYALETFFDVFFQIIYLLKSSHLMIPFPTIYDNYEGELPLVLI